MFTKKDRKGSDKQEATTAEEVAPTFTASHVHQGFANDLSRLLFKVAAKCLRNLAETGKVDWTAALEDAA